MIQSRLGVWNRVGDSSANGSYHSEETVMKLTTIISGALERVSACVTQSRHGISCEMTHSIVYKLTWSHWVN